MRAEPQALAAEVAVTLGVGHAGVTAPRAAEVGARGSGALGGGAAGVPGVLRGPITCWIAVGQGKSDNLGFMDQPTHPDTYDSPWKEILESYFPEFMAFFFPEIHAQIDWSRGWKRARARLRS